MHDAPTSCLEPGHGRVIDAQAWYEEHEALAYQLLHLAVKSAVQPSADAGRQAQATHAALLDHALEIAGVPAPRVMARDGVHVIPYERLAEARAKVRILEQENSALRARLAPAAQAGTADVAVRRLPADDTEGGDP
ncbi:hypothetical protein [Ottowia testudinis]|uniref:Uncharacterized protein n=1 Tax=Ottowia testudinis TaxID=2816950 RepID=A0A975H278_9BURK|nr:hypothetical protein [Ottowia testudinis]QTD44583.1 hypothetical protein J1M35_16015 [Ottowia testudinis]